MALKLERHHYVILYSVLVILVLANTVQAYASIQANNDVASAYQGIPASIDVLQNDYNSNPTATMNVEIVASPLHGSAVFDPNTQLVTYTSSPDYYGTDSFTYQINDGSSLSNIATVSITVYQIIQPNAAPVAVSDTFSTNENTPIILNVLANDHDPEGDPLSIVHFTGPSHGSVSLRSDNTFRYIPSDEYTGPDSFTYTISDGHPHGPITTETAVVNITVLLVNHPPVAQADFPVTNANTPIKISVLSNDHDPDEGDTISIISVATPSHGSAVINPNQTITYTPAPNFFGSDSFSYVISDNHGLTASALVNIIVHGLPSPVITNPSSSLLSNNILQTISGTSNSNAIINLYDGATLVGTTTANSLGMWSIQISLSSDGLHAMSAQATDSTGTLSSTSNIVNITIDTTNPISTISSPADNSFSTSTTVPLSGTSSDANLSTTQISVDGGAFQATSGTAASWAYSATGLSQGTHTFQTQATDLAGNTGLSSIVHVTVTIPVTTVPNAPTSLAATPGDSQVTLTWNTPSSDGGSAITGYDVYRGTTSGGQGSSPIVSGVSSGYVDHTVTNGNTYYYTVKAVNAIGSSVASSETSATPTTALTVPGAPTSLAATPSDSQVTLIWNAPSSNGGSPITDYTVEFRTGVNAFTPFTHTPSTATSLTVTGLTNGVTYDFRVSSVNSIGSSSPSSPISATPATHPTSTISSPADNSFSTSTTVPLSGTSSGTNLSTTKISVDGGAFQATSGTAASWAYSATGLSQGTHTFQSKATDLVGNTGLSSVVHVIVDIVNPTITISSPSNGATINTSSFTVSGSAFDVNLGKVYVSIDSGTFQPATGTSSWSFAVTGLGNGFHIVTAKATDLAGHTQTTSITITVKIPANEVKVSGKGAIGKTTDFDFKVQSKDGISSSGNLEYADKSNKIDLASISITSLSVDSSNKNASFSGTAKLNGKSGYTFNVYVEDNGNSGKNDFFSIKIFNSAKSTIYEKSNKLTEGKIQIQKSKLDH